MGFGLAPSELFPLPGLHETHFWKRLPEFSSQAPTVATSEVGRGRGVGIFGSVQRVRA